MDLVARAAAAQAASTTSEPAATAQPTLIFETPSLTTTFTPPPACTQAHLTMLQTDAYKVWMNEPLPVANSTSGSCYPDAFLTSYLQYKSGTTVPAFSPLVCPENYGTVFTAESPDDRPLYIACCPSNFRLGEAPPSTFPGRPAYNRTCYSDLPASTDITQFDDSSQIGTTVWSSTSGQAYAPLIDGYALQQVLLDTPGGATPTGSQTGSITFPGTNPSSSATAAASTANTLTTPQLAGLIAGSVGGVIVTVAILTAIFLLWRRRGKRQKQERNVPSQSTTPRTRPYHYPQNPHVGPYLAKSPMSPASFRTGATSLDEKALPMPPRTYKSRATYNGRTVAEMHQSTIKELPAESYTERDSNGTGNPNDRFLYLDSESSRASDQPQELAASNPQRYTTDIQSPDSFAGADSATAVDRSVPNASPRSQGNDDNAYNTYNTATTTTITSLTNTNLKNNNHHNHNNNNNRNPSGTTTTTTIPHDPSHWRDTQATQTTQGSADWNSAYDSLYETYGPMSPIRSPGATAHSFPNPFASAAGSTPTSPTNHSNGFNGHNNNHNGHNGSGHNHNHNHNHNGASKSRNSVLEDEVLRSLDAAHRVGDGVHSPVDAPASAHLPYSPAEGYEYSPDVSPKTLLPRTFEPMPQLSEDDRGGRSGGSSRRGGGGASGGASGSSSRGEGRSGGNGNGGGGGSSGASRGPGQGRAAELSRAAEYRRRTELYEQEAAINPFATPPAAPSPISASAGKRGEMDMGLEMRSPVSPDEEMRERERDGRSYNW